MDMREGTERDGPVGGATARLLLLTPPQSMVSGSDRFGARTVRELRRGGINASQCDIWPDRPARWMNRWLPYAMRGPLFKYAVAAPALRRLAGRIHAGDVVWLLDPALPDDVGCAFELGLRRLGARYVFHFQDNWLDLPSCRYQQMARKRLALADLVTVPTQALAERVQAEFPTTRLAVVDEPIDVERLTVPRPPVRVGMPLVVWAGNIHNLGEIRAMADILGDACAVAPFSLRIISGQRPRRRFAFRCSWEFTPYDFAREGIQLAEAGIALAPLRDGAFARCKGAYKLKVYMAAGLAPIVAPVGQQATWIRHGENGLLARTETEWRDAIVMLVRDPARTRAIGEAARRYAVSHFAHAVVIPKWTQMLRDTFPEMRT